jgi:hypothetical protein
MKKHFLLLITVIFTNITQTINAQCGTAPVDVANYVQYSSLSDMAIAPDNKIYTFAYNTANLKFELYSAYASTSWSLVAAFTGSTTIKPDISVSKSGKVSVFLRDDADGSKGKVYTLSGSSFISVGSGPVSPGGVTNLSITFDASNDEYIAYSDIINSSRATVKKWNSTLVSWDNVGVGVVSPNVAVYNSLVIDNAGNPVLAFEDGSVGYKTNVMRYIAGAWSSLGIIGTVANNCKLKVASNNDYYLGYTETTNTAVVQKYNGSTWAPIGTAIGSITSSANTFDIGLDAVDSPYLLAITTSTPDIVFYRFTGSSWAFITSFSNTGTNILSLSIDNIGTPFLFHVNSSFNNGLNVKRLTSSLAISSQPLSVTSCDAQFSSFNIGTVGGVPNGYQWQTSTGSNFTNSSAPYSGSTTNSLSFITNASLNQNFLRCIVDAGCKNIISNTATLTVSSVSIATSFTNPTCYNTNNGAITTTVTGSMPPYNYSWNTGATTPGLSGIYGNTYTLNIFDNAACITTSVITLNSPPSISSSFAGNMTICNGSSTTLTITATGGTGGLTYSWTPSGSVSPTTGSVVTANPLADITYNVQVTDALGCISTPTVYVTVRPPQTITANASSGTICNGGSTILSASGVNVDTYVWNPGGLAGASQNVTPSSTTIYTVVGTNTSTGCQISTTVTVTVNPIPTVNAGPTKTLTCANTSTTLAGSTTGGTSYNWTGPGIVSGGTTLNPTISAPGTYDLSVVSSFGCSAGPSPVTVFQNTITPSPTASTSGTLTCSTLTVPLNGAPATGVTYQWTGPGFSGGTTSQNAVANAAGSYTLKVTDAVNGCTNTAIASVTQNTVTPSPTANNIGPLTCATTSVALNGSPATGVTYLWSGPGFAGPTSAQNTYGNAAGTYTLKVTSSINGCTNTAVTTVAQNTVAPTPSANNTGFLTCVVTTATLSGGPATTVSYLWSGPGITGSTNTQTTTANAVGNYTLKVTSAVNGCTNTAITSLTQNTTAPVPTSSNTGPLTCTTTSVTLNGTPGTGVTYLWSGPGITGSTITQNTTANAAGTYTLKVTNSVNGCTNTAVTTVAQNTVAPTAGASNSSTLTCTNTSANLTGTGGGTYVWTGPAIASGGTTSSPVVTAPGCYTVTVTAVNGCTAISVTCINQNTTTPSANAGLDQTLTCTSPTVTLSGSATPSSCTPVWIGPVTSGANSYVATTSTPGTYSLTVTNPVNGCSATDAVNVTLNTFVPAIFIAPTSTLTCANTSVTVSASSSATLPTYLWSGPNIVSGANTANAIVDQPGNYTVTVTDVPTGCSATASVNIIQDIAIPSITITASPSVICAGNSSTLTASSNADPNTDYSWNPGNLNGAIQNVSPSSTGLYSVVVTNTINGCASNQTVPITVNAAPTLAITGNTTICKGSSTTLTGSGVTSYTWDSGANTATVSVTPTITTTYTLNGDNGNGCIGSLPVTVSIIPNKAISGIITNTAGATGGDIIIYKYTAALSHWDSLTITPLASTYSFNNMDSGLYVLRAIPTATNIQVTYADSSISWQDATIINHGCANNSTQDIKLIALAAYIVGPGVLTGNIVEAFGFVPRMSNESKPTVPGTPIGGIIVKGGKNPGGQMFVQTVTNAAGNYTLTGLPINTLPEDYFIFVDIPGLDTNSTYNHISIMTGSTTVNGLDFNVDAEYINPIGIVTGISNDKSVLGSKINLFPNPTSQKFTLEYELIQSANVQIELYDMVGHMVKSISQNSFEEKNSYSHSVNLLDVSAGVYFVKVKINNSETTIKLIIAN